MSPELGELAIGNPPQEAPRKARGLIPWQPGLDFVKNILRELQLPCVKCLSRAAKACGMAVPIGLALSLAGNTRLSLRFAALRVGTSDLKRKLSVVSFERTNPRRGANQEAARQKRDQTQKDGHCRSTLGPGASSPRARD